jgi:hypothetical protein
MARQSNVSRDENERGKDSGRRLVRRRRFGGGGLLLKQQGWQVVGLFMKNWEDDDSDEYCASRQDLIDVMSVADTLGIDVEVVNFAPNTRNASSPTSSANTRPAGRRIRMCCATRRSSSALFSSTP